MLENMLKCSISTVAADGLALLGARASADTVMTKVETIIFIKPALEGFCKQSGVPVSFLQNFENRPHSLPMIVRECDQNMQIINVMWWYLLYPMIIPVWCV